MEYLSRKYRLFVPQQRSNARGSHAGVSLGCVLSNWAALVALWALPYLTLLDHLRPDAARSEVLQWSLVVVGALGVGRLLYLAWRQTLDPAWRARHGLAPRERHGAPGY